jgi:type IV pilus assembly protein PilQ
MRIRFYLIVTFIAFFCQHVIYGQDRLINLEKQLHAYQAENSKLSEKINISVSGVRISEFLRGIAKSTGLNISIDNSLNFKVSNNFKDVAVADLLIFLCRQYDLDLKIQSNIIQISAFKGSNDDREKVGNQDGIHYSVEDSLITIDVNEVPLYQVSREITRQTGVNVLPDADIRNEKISGFVSKLPVDEAMLTLFDANNLLVLKDKKRNVWKISAFKSKGQEPSSRTPSMLKGSSVNFSKGESKQISGYVEITGGNDPRISVFANNGAVDALIKYVSDSLGVNYVFVGTIDQQITTNMHAQKYDDFLDKLLRGTHYGYKKEKGVYYFAGDDNMDFNEDKLIPLQNRTIESIMSSIPESLKKGVTLVEYPELNSLFLSGEKNAVARLEKFIVEIDQVIPVILIEVLIVDVDKNKSISTGINAGFGDIPSDKKPGQTIFPGIDYQLSTKQINNIFRKFESFSSINLGKVSPDFYLSIKALEENGYLSVRSTPKLSTLNGCKASLSSGETKYYKEEQSNYYGSQNPALSSSYTWKPINADMSLNILPVVSGDDQITLEIEVQQSEFTPREYENSPPGSVTRNFKSLIRVKNQEMVLLGGIDRESTQDTGSGTPLLSRIPVLKWLFSSRTKATSDSRLNVFIKPTILY